VMRPVVREQYAADCRADHRKNNQCECHASVRPVRLRNIVEVPTNATHRGFIPEGGVRVAHRQIRALSAACEVASPTSRASSTASTT
jgi:hypothetical protein